jgi:hypothetical protein
MKAVPTCAKGATLRGSRARLLTTLLLSCAVLNGCTAAGQRSFQEGYLGVPAHGSAVLREAEKPPSDMDFTPHMEQQPSKPGTGTPFDTVTGIPMYREWPNRPLQNLGEMSFTSTAVGGYDFTGRWIAAKVIEVGGNAAVISGIDRLSSEMADLGPYGANIPVLRQRIRAVVVGNVPLAVECGERRLG